MDKMRTLIFFMVMSSSVTLQIKENLTITEGGSITLPDRVMEQGIILYERATIAVLKNRVSEIWEESFRNRLLWSSSTGLITLTDLQKNYSGIYQIESKKGNVFIFSYKLTVYECVLQPAVNASAVSPDSCTLVCFVEKGDETTLLWYRGEEIVNQSSSDLSLPLTLHKQDFNSPFKCVAANPLEEKSVSVTVTVYCGQNNQEETSGNNRRIGLILIPIVITLALASSFITWIFCKKPWRQEGTQLQDSARREEDVVYSDIQIRDNRERQAENVPDSSVHVYDLASVYDKLELHRIVPTPADAV